MSHAVEMAVLVRPGEVAHAGYPGLRVQPMVVLPAPLTNVRRLLIPEERLMMAVLMDAIECVRHPADTKMGRQLFREAQQWIMDRRQRPFSFEHLCDVLRLEPSCVRRRLAPWLADRPMQAGGFTALTPQAPRSVSSEPQATGDLADVA